MPNWIRNKLDVNFNLVSDNIENRKKCVNNFIEKIMTNIKYPDGDKKIFDFNKIVKSPYNSDADEYYEEKQQWHISNWGTKWNSSNCFISIDKNFYKNISILYDTANSSPTFIIKKLKKMFPVLSITNKHIY